MLQSATRCLLRHLACAYGVWAAGRVTNLSYDVTSVHSRTWMFFFLHMYLSIFGHRVMLTSPRCAWFGRSM